MSELENTVKNLEICRLCLNLTVTKINIFTDDFAKMVEIITCLKIKPEDNLPKVSCLKCARDVKSAFLVRRRIIQSYRAFNNKINRLDNRRYINTSRPSANGLNIYANSNGLNTSTNRITSYNQQTQVLRENLNKTSLSEESNEDSKEGSETDAETAGDSISEPEWDNKSLEKEKLPANVVIKMEKEKNEVNKTDADFFNRLEPEVEVRTDSNISTHQAQRIQSFKLDISSKYINQLKALDVKQKLNAWKLMNKRDQLHIIKWMEKKKISTKNLASKLSTTQHKKREPLKMYCNHCQIKFTNKIAFKNHMTRHKHKTCPVCEKQIRSSYLKKHMTLHEDAPVICEICGQTCKNACSLRMHFFYYHKNPNFCVCEDCGRSFRTKTKLIYHQRKDHTKERNYKCEICGKTFFLKIYLTKHINMKHMKLRPHICEYCGKGFSGKHALRTHVRQHTNEAPYHCNLCGERFRQRVSLRGHMKSRHNIEEENTVFCETCGKGFASVVALDVHSRLHSEIKCPWCTDTFADKNYLEQHITTIHSNVQEENVVEDGGLKWMNL